MNNSEINFTVYIFESNKHIVIVAVDDRCTEKGFIITNRLKILHSNWLEHHRLGFRRGFIFRKKKKRFNLFLILLLSFDRSYEHVMCPKRLFAKRDVNVILYHTVGRDFPCIYILNVTFVSTHIHMRTCHFFHHTRCHFWL